MAADSVIRAVRAYTCLTPDNQWVEPPSRGVFSTAPHAASADPAPAQLMLSYDSGCHHPSSSLQELIDTPAISK